jgi:PST family polysaccharide transporter
MKDLKHASTRGVAWNLVQNVISRILALIVVAILSRLLDRTAFGGVALAMAITAFVELLVNQGYGDFVTQTPELKDEHLDTAFWFNVMVGGFFTAAIALSAGPLAVQFDEPSVAPVIRWLSLSLLIRSFSVVPAGVLVRTLRFRSLSMRAIVASAVGGIVGIVAALAGLGVYSLVLQLLVGDFTATVVLWTATDWRPGRRVSKEALKQLSAFGTPIIGATLLGFVSRRLDTLIVGGALGLGMLGVYSMAQRGYQIALQVINKSTTDVAFSALSRLADTEERRRQAFYKMIELTAVLCFPPFGGLALIAEPLSVTLVGAQWTDSAVVLVFFALSGVPFSLSLIHIAVIKSAAKTRYLFFINLVLLALYLPFMVLMVDGGPGPAAAASLISCVLIMPFELWFMRAAVQLRVGQYFKAMIGATIATLVMTAAVLAITTVSRHWSPIVRLGLLTVVGGVTYVIALRTLAPASFNRCRDLALSTFRRNRS